MKNNVLVTCAHRDVTSLEESYPVHTYPLMSDAKFDEFIDDLDKVITKKNIGVLCIMHYVTEYIPLEFMLGAGTLIQHNPNIRIVFATKVKSKINGLIDGSVAYMDAKGVHIYRSYNGIRSEDLAVCMLANA